MGVQPLTRVWRKNKRRVLNLQAGLARRRLKAVRKAFYKDLWINAADKLGATLEPCPNGLVKIRRGQFATFVSHSDLMLDSEITLRVFANKALHYDLMASKAVRLPAFLRFTLETVDQAEAFLKTQSGPIVIKPADGTGGGRGVITNITDGAGLQAAAKHAAGFNPVLLAEEQLTGACFRLIYFNGEFLDAVRRDSPMVTGDGSSTIAQLVKAENTARADLDNITALNPLILDHESRNTLAADGRSASTVLAAGETGRVKLAVNENAAAQNHIVRTDVHPEIIEIGARLVREFGIKFAGLDITSDDISAAPEDGNTIYNEINVNPGIHHHYLVANPQQSAEVAPTLLERMFATRMGIIEL